MEVRMAIRSGPWLAAAVVGGLIFSVNAGIAGQNAGASARMYWQVGTGSGSVDRKSTDPVPQLVVTVSGVKNLRGADIQLRLMGHGHLPEAWQVEDTGCASAAATFRR